MAFGDKGEPQDLEAHLRGLEAGQGPPGGEGGGVPRVALQEGLVKLLCGEPRPLGEVGPEEEGEGFFPPFQVLQGFPEVLALVQPERPVVGGLGPEKVPVDALKRPRL